jgi:hypothetical protein
MYVCKFKNQTEEEEEEEAAAVKLVVEAFHGDNDDHVCVGRNLPKKHHQFNRSSSYFCSFFW